MKWLDKYLRRGGAAAPYEGQALPEQLARKHRSEARLRAEHVPINQWLPVIDETEETVLRSPQEVADRLLALTIAAVKAEGLDEETIDRIIRERQAADFFSPAELRFIRNPDPSMHERAQFSWRYEAAWTLLWALSLIDDALGMPSATCDVPRLATIVRDEKDLARNGLRPACEILDEADLIFRYHWAVRDASLNGRPLPAGLNGGVTIERHQTLNWLIGYNDRADWDEVTTDT